MPTDKFQILASARAKVIALEQQVMTEINRELAALPAQYGFADTASFLKAVKAAGGGKRARRGRPPKKSSRPAHFRRKKRAVVTDAIRAQVKQMAGAEKTGAQIAKALGLSLPTVQNIKKALGLVKKRK